MTLLTPEIIAQAFAAGFGVSLLVTVSVYLAGAVARTIHDYK